MTREEIYKQCVEEISKTNCLLLQSATGTGKSKVSIDLTNYLINSKWYVNAPTINILLLVYRDIHKITWKEEIQKWGGFHHPTANINVCIECYASLQNHCRERWDVIIADETHHIGSQLKLDYLNTMSFGYYIGLSATIPKKTLMYFRYKYHAAVVSCDIVEAIDDGVLPEPQILLFPLMLEDRQPTETWEFNKDAPGPIVHAEFKDIRKYKYNKRIHSIISMTQRQKLMEFNSLIDFFKRNYKDKAKLYMAGKRLEYLADIKLPIIKDILRHLDDQRTITFCRSVTQASEISKNCIHYNNKDSKKIYEAFNAKKIHHISAVNILNENANLVDCKYAVFCNFSSSEVVIPQRLGRSMRHSSPVIIFPYYEGTREEEIVRDYVEGFNKDYIRVIHSIKEI